MRTRFIILAVVLQVLVLGYMAGEREWVVRFGRPVLLRTAPIDPNDPMRGYYARFNYDISSVPSSLWRDKLPGKLANNANDYRAGRDLRVYAALELDDSGVAELVSLSDRPPVNGLYLKGRINSVGGQRASVRYGIEALFMQQGESQKLEDARRTERPGAPIDAEIAVSSSGLAVLKGYHWEPLGISATFERAAIAPPGTAPTPAVPAYGTPRARPQTLPQRQFIVTAKVELKNYGPEDVAIVDLPDGGSFRLLPDARGQEIRYHWTGENQSSVKPEAAHVIILKPGQSHVTTIDLTQPRWFVTDAKAKADKQKPMPLREITEAWSASFRLEYAPPDKAAAAALPHADLIGHGKLLSRAFNPTQGMD